MNENDSTRLHDMLNEARRAQKFAASKQRDDLSDDDMLAYAIVRCLEIIGEAASHVTTETRNNYPQVAWREIVGMRNRIVHDYVGVDLDIVWETVVTVLPDLITKLEYILSPS